MKKKTVTVNQILLGDEAGGLMDQITEDGFNPEVIAIIAMKGNDVRVRHSCRSLAELLGLLLAASDSVRG